MSFKKVSMIFFIIGTLIALFSGAFEAIEGLESVKLITLIVLGLIVGLLNISEEQQIDFLIASLVFMFSANIIITFSPGRLMMLQGIFLMLQNLMIFIAPAAVVISLKIVFEYASESDKNLEWEMPSPKDRHYGENLWDMIVFVSVAFVLVILVLESFFDLSGYPGLVSLLAFIDYIIVGIFVIDLFVIYNKVRNVKLFLMRNWIDILAVIPFGSVFRLTKLVRVVRIMRIFSGAQKASKVNRISKFFSDNSGFNKLLVRDKKDSGKKGKKSGKKTTKTRKK